MENWLDVEYEEFRNLKKYSGKFIQVELSELFAMCACVQVAEMMGHGEAAEAMRMLAEKIKDTVKEQYPDDYQSYFLKPYEEE